jgi:hypothetical protein
MDAMVLATAGVGFVLGMRHALDPDHVAAVSTMLGRGAGVRRSSLVGTFWGLGHALSLLAAGGAIVALRLSIPDAATRWVETAVALMLVGLGAGAIRAALQGYSVHAHAHAHDGHEHVHFHAHRAGASEQHHHAHPLGCGARPFLVGMLHGLAGSAGVALLALASAPSRAAALLYLAALAGGSLLGMLVLSGLMSLPLSLFARRYQALHLRFRLLAGALSFGVGLWLFGHSWL